jgi:hypothetical protein
MKGILVTLFVILMLISSGNISAEGKPDGNTSNKESYILDEIIVTARGYASEIKKCRVAQG